VTNPDRPTTPTSTSDMLERTRRRAETLRRRRRAALSGVAAVVVATAIAIPVLTSSSHRGRQVGVLGTPTSITRPSSSTTAPAAATSTSQTSPTTAPAGPTPASTTTGPTTSGPTTTSPSTTGPTTTGPTQPGTVPACATSQLRASLTNPSGAAGSVGYTLVLLNTGTTTCSLRSYPGVSYVNSNSGSPIGAPALRDSVTPIVTVDLAPGKAAQALLLEADPLNFPSNTCQLTNVAGLRVYPPNQTASLFIPQATHACSGAGDPDLQVSPVQPS
jgi:Protein of unknown function (DUF4232)